MVVWEHRCKERWGDGKVERKRDSMGQRRGKERGRQKERWGDGKGESKEGEMERKR